jgi:hypothetical protein
MVGIHRTTLVKWLATGQLPEPRRIVAARQSIRVWSDADVARAKALKEAHGAAALAMKTGRLLKADDHRRARRTKKSLPKRA